MVAKPQESHNALGSSRILNLLSERAVWVGLLIRLGLAWFLPWALDDEGLLPGVAYTDIDYHVFTDAASYIQQGQSPYERDTYRYTPFLAALLALLPREGGRYLFCLADAACGWMIVHFRQKARRSSLNIISPSTPIISPRLQDALWWLYNPLAINICTRGSAESLMVLLPVLLTYAAVSSWAGGNNKSWTSVILAGFWHGVAIHSKLYPVIYTLSFMTFFAPPALERPALSKFSSLEPSRGLSFLPSYLWSWARRLLQPAPVLFLATSLMVFAVLTYLAVLYYGQQALEEGLLYHFSRVDHRHNYSMHWFWIYLARARGGGANMALVGRLLLLPQLTLLFYTSLGIAPHNLSLALFVQTFLFVAHNKVITAQYFTWYLCLLPLCSESLAFTRRVAIALGALLVAVGFWLGSAYCLEMQGMAVHRIVWLASVVFFGANVNLLGAILDSYRVKTTAQNKAD
jgi:phosphatidylinositol glycan class M